MNICVVITYSHYVWAVDGSSAERQQLQTTHSASIPHSLPVPQGSGQVQEVRKVSLLCVVLRLWSSVDGFLFNACSSSCVLNDDQSLWIEDTTKLVYQVCFHHKVYSICCRCVVRPFITIRLSLFLFKLLRETPPDGDKFASMVEVNSGCKMNCLDTFLNNVIYS